MTGEEAMRNKNKIVTIKGKKYRDVTWKYIDNKSKTCVGVYEPYCSNDEVRL